MTFRGRLTLVAAAAVAIAVALAAGVSFVIVRHQLRHEVDVTLRRTANRAISFPLPDPSEPRLARGPFRTEETAAQLLQADGTKLGPPDPIFVLPVDKRDLAVAAGTSRTLLRDVSAGHTHVRMITTPVRPGVAFQLGRSLDEQDRVLRRLGLILAAVALGGVALAAGLGLLVARAALAPVAHLTAAAEHVASTEDLSASIDVPQGKGDELARLATSFNAMLAALASSRKQQRQLVADASHELRTPLTSLRTNIEVLAASDGMPEGDRAKLLADVTAQLGELTDLVGDLVELARDDRPPADEMVDVRLDDIVGRAVDRARRRSPSLTMYTDIEPCLVVGLAAMLERAVTNVLDNAVKWSPPGGTVEVSLHGGEITVRDHGPGIDATDLPYVFDRFYRSPGARSTPGSGLGLAIVRQVATAHGGSVSAATVDGGGTVVRLKLNAVAGADPQPWAGVTLAEHRH